MLNITEKLLNMWTFSKQEKLLSAYHRLSTLESSMGTESSTSTGLPAHRHTCTVEAMSKVMFVTFSCGLLSPCNV